MAKETYKKLDDYNHSRLRTELYLGSRELHTQSVLNFDGNKLSLKEFTYVPALFVALRELWDNALDEMLGHGYGDTLRVSYDENEMVFTVSDNGRGLPIDERPELGKGPAASILLGEARAGRNFEERGEVAGTNGLGAACTNFTSEWFEIDVYNNGKRLKQQWQEGKYGGNDIHKTKGPNIIRGSKGKSGTTIRFKPSSKVFPHLALPEEFILGRLWDIAVSNTDLKVFFNERKLTPAKGTYSTDTVMATYFKKQVPKISILTNDQDEHVFSSNFYLVPEFTEESEEFHSLVNNLPALQGGSHIDAFKNMFYTTAVEYLSNYRGSPFKKEKLILTRQDVSNGLMIFNITKMNAPNFDSQTKGRLITEVKTVMKGKIDLFEIGSAFRRNPEWVNAILERCRQRISNKQKNAVKKQQKKISKTKIAKLTDATSKDRQKCILFLGEGDSALNEMMNVRNPSIHGCLPLRGKILNVHGVTPKKVIESQALVDIMTSVGLQIGETATVNNLRYGSIYIATDEDEDGKNISSLLVNFLFRFWPELFTTLSPIVYKFSTPFIIAQKGNSKKYIYADDYPEFQLNLDKYKGWGITRAKGLGALEGSDWEHALANPVLIPIIDDGKMKETLDLIFNKERADDRKEWLSQQEEY